MQYLCDNGGVKNGYFLSKYFPLCLLLFTIRKVVAHANAGLVSAPCFAFVDDD
jgi:hypothetical protein